MKHGRCLGFGTNYNEESEECINCKDKEECKKEYLEEQIAIEAGLYKDIKALKPIEQVKNPILISVEKYDKVLRIDLRINIEWLKKKLEGE